MSYLEEMYHCCKYCHWYDRSTGCCLHENTFSSDIDVVEMVRDLSEEGLISGAIEESFSDGDFSKVENALV